MFKLAWLNLWRNPRRTCISIASVCFAVFFCILMNSAYDGIWNAAIQNILRMQKGHLEIHHKSDGKDMSAENFMAMGEDDLQRLSGVAGITDVLPRIETFAMASSGDLSQGVAVLGIYPALERRRMDLASMLVEGVYLTEQDRGVLMGEALSRYLGIHVGDSIVMIGKGYHGVSAVGLYPVRGILSIPVPQMDRSVVYMNIESAQEFIGLLDGYSCVYLLLEQDKRLLDIQSQVAAMLPADKYEIHNWKNVMTELLAYSETTHAIGLIVNIILYLLVGSGILSTVIMLINERRYEFGMLLALGMQRSWLVISVFYELLLIMVIGSSIAVATALPIISHFSKHAILLKGNSAKFIQEYLTKPEFTCYVGVDLFVEQLLVVLLISCMVMLYPTFVLLKLKINQVLKQ